MNPPRCARQKSQRDHPFAVLLSRTLSIRWGTTERLCDQGTAEKIIELNSNPPVWSIGCWVPELRGDPEPWPEGLSGQAQVSFIPSSTHFHSYHEALFLILKYNRPIEKHELLSNSSTSCWRGHMSHSKDQGHRVIASLWQAWEIFRTDIIQSY